MSTVEKRTGVKDIRRKKGQTDGRTIIGQRNRQALIDSAATLFTAKGYASVSIRAICTDAGVGLGTFYNHFKDKEAILSMVLNEDRAISLARQHDLRASVKTFPEFVTAHFSFFFEAVFKQPVYLDLLGSDLALFRRVIEKPNYLQGIQSLRLDLQSAIDRGLLAPIDTEALTAAIMGIALELGRVMIRRPNPDPAEATRFAAQLLLTGLPWKNPGS